MGSSAVTLEKNEAGEIILPGVMEEAIKTIESAQTGDRLLIPKVLARAPSQVTEIIRHLGEGTQARIEGAVLFVKHVVDGKCHQYRVYEDGSGLPIRTSLAPDCAQYAARTLTE